MFSLLDLCFVLCSLDLDVLRAQRIMGFYILITHKSTRSENPITWLSYLHLPWVEPSEAEELSLSSHQSFLLQASTPSDISFDVQSPFSSLSCEISKRRQERSPNHFSSTLAFLPENKNNKESKSYLKYDIRSNSRSEGKGKTLRVENRRVERVVFERRILAKNNDGRQTSSEVKSRVGHWSGEMERRWRDTTWRARHCLVT